MAGRKRDQPPPANAREALERAGLHARRAAVELVAAAHDVLDAASLGWSGQPSASNETLRVLASGLDELGDRLERGDAELPEPVARVVLTALDEEIERWQERSATDRDARAVLRAFLGIREILWELGFRRADAATASQRGAPPGKTVEPKRTAARGKRDAAKPSPRAGRGAASTSGGSGQSAHASGAPRVRRLARVKDIRDEG